MPAPDVREALLVALERSGEPAAFVSELHAALPQVDAASLDASLERLRSERAIVLVGYEAPDPHLQGVDLRIAAPVREPGAAGEAAATQAVGQRWNSWLREFLANHRCS